MTVPNKIPVTIITGFLGAGKTTLIRHVLERVKDRQLALLINEFGDVGVDGAILQACDSENCARENIIELTNGCLCCTVADDFLPAIDTLLKHERRPAHIIVETSGLALPKPLIKAFDWPDVRARLTVDGVIAVVDAAAVADGRFAHDPEAVAAQRSADPSLDHDNPLEEVYEDQLLAADLVVLNKVDLLPQASSRQKVMESVAALLPDGVKLVPAREGQIDPAILLGIGAHAEDDLNNRPSHHDNAGDHDHDDFSSFCVSIPEITDPDQLIARLEALVARHDILRIKGFAAVAGKPMPLLVQGVGRRFRYHYDRALQKTAARSGALVVIGRKGLNEKAVIADLAA